MALHGVLAFAILTITLLASCEVPTDPFKNGQEQAVHDKGMYPDKVTPDTVPKDRMDTATDPSMDGKP